MIVRGVRYRATIAHDAYMCDWFLHAIACIPKPYKIVGHDPLNRRSNPYNGRFLDPQVLVFWL